MSTQGGRWSPKKQKHANVVCERPLQRKIMIIKCDHDHYDPCHHTYAGSSCQENFLETLGKPLSQQSKELSQFSSFSKEI